MGDQQQILKCSIKWKKKNPSRKHHKGSSQLPLDINPPLPPQSQGANTLNNK